MARDKRFQVWLEDWHDKVLKFLVYRHGAKSKAMAIRICIAKVAADLGLDPSTLEKE